MILLGESWDKEWYGKGPDPGIVWRDFLPKAEQIEGVEILLAWYDDPWGYSGEAFVLFRKDGKLFEVNGSHCSCYGLEDQWEPEETDAEALIFRLGNENDEGDRLGRHGETDYFATALRDMLTTPQESPQSQDPAPEVPATGKPSQGQGDA